MPSRKIREVAEFGDFQTPDDLATRVVSLLRTLGATPATIVEPSCGRGSFLEAAAGVFPEAKLLGFDINDEHIRFSAKRLAFHSGTTLTLCSFFDQKWDETLADCHGPLLVLGNPPWVTNSDQSLLGSANLPVKSNFQNRKGLDAITGKSNFDISEAMLLENLRWIERHGGLLAVLCKTAVARKILVSAWKRGASIRNARIYRIDALSIFGAAVDACLLYLNVGNPDAHQCAVYDTLDEPEPAGHFGFVDGKAISNMNDYFTYRHLLGVNRTYTWRSGVKHDCSKVMEFDIVDGILTNGYGERVEIEDTYLYPLLKSSDIAGAQKRDRRKCVLVTQQAVGSETDAIRNKAPKTWNYLLAHGDTLDGRTSSIYRGKPRFSIFGVGDYSFAPWKVAISGLYKNLSFRIYGPRERKPIFFDDTVYFLPFLAENEAQVALELIQSHAAQTFLKSMIFWDEKRPVTVDVLKRLDIAKLADVMGRRSEIEEHRRPSKHERAHDSQLPLVL